MDNEKKFKILAAGDIHGDSALATKLAQRAEKENVDLVVLAGDLTFFEESVDNIIGPFAKANKKVLLLHGNHEDISTINFLEEKYSNAKNLHGKSLKMGDIGIFGSGGTTQVGPFSMMAEHDMYKFLMKGFYEIKDSKLKIMVTHEHPANTQMQKIGMNIPGSESIEGVIRKFQPDLALCSHLHEAWGVEEQVGNTRVVNVGREGKIIEIIK